MINFRLGSIFDSWKAYGDVHVKFKVVFILFNAVIVVSFLIIYLMPVAMLGWEYTQVFWNRNWALPILFISILAILNGYFIFNWRLFRLLEREDWDGLIEHLERRFYQKNLIIAQHCRILINAYLVRGQIDGIGKLENEIREKRPRLMQRLVVPLGVRHLLSNDSDAMVEYFGGFKEIRSRDTGWVRWSFGFAKLLGEEREEAETELKRVASQERNPVLRLLSLYLLATAGDDDIKQYAREQAKTLSDSFTNDRMTAEIDKQRSNVQVVILARLIEEATDWLYSPDV